MADDGEAGQVPLQKGSRRPQREIASFVRDEPTDEDQFKLFLPPRVAWCTGEKGAADAVLWDKEKLLAIGCELGISLRGACDDGRRIAIGGPSERHETVQIPHVGNPLLLPLGLAETWRPRQTTVDRSDYEGDGTSPEEESERTWQDRGDRRKTQHHIEVARHNSRPHAPPGAPFKRQTKDVVEGRQNLAAVIILKDPTYTPGIDAIEPQETNGLDGMKGGLLAAQGRLVAT